MEKKYRLKSKEDLERILMEDGFVKNEYGDWEHPDRMYFLGSMFGTCPGFILTDGPWKSCYISGEREEGNFSCGWTLDMAWVEEIPECIPPIENPDDNVVCCGESEVHIDPLDYGVSSFAKDRLVDDAKDILEIKSDIPLLKDTPMAKEDTTIFTDKHYDFTYQITQEDIDRGYIKLDPYFISKQWQLGSKDESGALWHIFKTIARFGVKNPIEREIKAMEASIKRMKDLYNIT